MRRLRQQVETAASVAPLARGQAREGEAETMITLGLGEEAQAMLRLAAADDPAIAASADMAGLSGIAALLSGRLKEADGVADPRLDGTDEVTLWRAVRAAEAAPGSPAAAAGFAATAPLIAAYPRALRERLLPLAFETMIEGGQSAAAARLMPHLTDEPSLAMARAMLNEANGNIDGALGAYDILAAGRDRLVHATAAVRAVELRLRAGYIDTAHAADALDGLLFAWRGDSRELALRERVADLREQTGAWRSALAMLHETEALFPDDKNAVHARLKSAFARLLHDAALDRLAPLELVALVDENSDLLPEGPAGEALEERLADRLLTLDLPQRAAPVLAKLMKTAPTAAGRAGFGARLAALRLRENDAQGALAALAASAATWRRGRGRRMQIRMRRRPPRQCRRRPCLARSSSGAHCSRPRRSPGRATRNARSLISRPSAPRRRMRRGRRSWSTPRIGRPLNTRWPTTSPRSCPSGGAVPPDAALDLTQQRALVRYATAAAQAGDDATLAQLRTAAGPRMPAGAFGDMFRLLTAEPVRGLDDLPRASRETAMAHDLPKALDALKPPSGLVAPARAQGHAQSHAQDHAHANAQGQAAWSAGHGIFPCPAACPVFSPGGQKIACIIPPRSLCPAPLGPRG